MSTKRKKNSYDFTLERIVTFSVFVNTSRILMRKILMTKNEKVEKRKTKLIKIFFCTISETKNVLFFGP